MKAVPSALHLNLEQKIGLAVAPGLVDEGPVELDRGRIGKNLDDIVRQVIAKQCVCARRIGQEHPEQFFMWPGRDAAAGPGTVGLFRSGHAVGSIRGWSNRPADTSVSSPETTGKGTHTCNRTGHEARRTNMDFYTETSGTKVRISSFVVLPRGYPARTATGPLCPWARDTPLPDNPGSAHPGARESAAVHGTGAYRRTHAFLRHRRRGIADCNGVRVRAATSAMPGCSGPCPRLPCRLGWPPDARRNSPARAGTLPRHRSRPGCTLYGDPNSLSPEWTPAGPDSRIRAG